MKYCYNNVFNHAKLVDITAECFDVQIDWRFFYQVGYGQSADADGTIYGVRIYFTKQTSRETFIFVNLIGF
jgi:hypothetical protein